MGGTAIAIVFSPFGKRSGAHFNPAVTLTFWRLGKVKGIGRGLLCHRAIRRRNCSAWRWSRSSCAKRSPIRLSILLRRCPASAACAIAFLAELADRLHSDDDRVAGQQHAAPRAFHRTFRRLPGRDIHHFRGAAFRHEHESGAHFGSAFVGQMWTALWIYFIAPMLAMQLAAAVYLRTKRTVYCAKFHHHNAERCIFNCRFAELAERNCSRGR